MQFPNQADGSQYKLVLTTAANTPQVHCKQNNDSNGGPEPPYLWRASDEELGFTSDNLWCEALGVASEGAITGYKLSLGDAGGHVLEAGINLVVSTHNGPAVFSVLNRILEPLRANPLNASGAVATIEREQTLKSLRKAEQQYRLYQESEILPNQDYLSELARKIARL